MSSAPSPSGAKGRPLGTVDQAAAVSFGKKYFTTKNVVFVVNNDRFFLTHRASWASAMAASGAKVTVIAQDTGHASGVRSLGFDYISLHFGRESVSPKDAIATAFRLFFHLVRLRPAIVFLVATATYSLGWPAALVMPKTKFIRVITGAGRALAANGDSSRASRFVQMALGIAARLRNVYSLFQLTSDQERFVAAGLAVAGRSYLIPGTGLDTDVWKPLLADRQGDVPVVLFAARLFREKGIYEFVDLARSTPEAQANFVVVGKPDHGVSSSVSQEELSSWQENGWIQYLGESDDMLSVYRNADIFILPSTHPEGTPRTLIEAAACGVVAIASDQEGCRAVVEHGETGLIADVSKPGEFSSSLHTLLVDPGYRNKLAKNARSGAIRNFSLETTLTKVYRLSGIVP
ncbi:glycosyltransferase [Arthrobacter sp. Leaf137]|uniref:glycosyltransferase n=1 Tax=Arthrobacter sp. Leaf137 TaxID=1736271 RepID=UPI000B212A8B|nr:glycosyltransferase [Arthrobacter sp. Leaf137]